MAIRELKGSWRTEPLGGNPQWLVLDEIVVADLTTSATPSTSTASFRYWPIFWRVQDRVGPWYTMGPLNINGRVKSIGHPPRPTARSSTPARPTAACGRRPPAATRGVTCGSSRTAWRSGRSPSRRATATSSTPAPASTRRRRYGPSYGGVGLFRSGNGGATWTNTVGADVIGSRCTRVVVHPTNSNRVYVATDARRVPLDERRRRRHPGAQRSRSATSSWPTTTRTCSTPASGTTASTRRSTAGMTWNRIQGNILSIFAILFGWKEDFPTGDGGRVDQARRRPPRRGRLELRRRQARAPTRRRRSSPPTPAPAGSRSPAARACDYDEWCSMVAVHPRQPRHIYIGGLGSAALDGRLELQPVTGHALRPPPDRVPPDPTTHTAFVACDGGVYRTTNNGASWSLCSWLLTATQLMSLGVSSSGAVRRRLGDPGPGHHPDRRVVRLDGSRRRQRVGDVRRRSERLAQHLHLARRRAAATQHRPRA